MPCPPLLDVGGGDVELGHFKHLHPLVATFASSLEAPHWTRPVSMISGIT